MGGGSAPRQLDKAARRTSLIASRNNIGDRMKPTVLRLELHIPQKFYPDTTRNIGNNHQFLRNIPLAWGVPHTLPVYGVENFLEFAEEEVQGSVIWSGIVLTITFMTARSKHIPLQLPQLNGYPTQESIPILHSPGKFSDSPDLQMSRIGSRADSRDYDTRSAERPLSPPQFVAHQGSPYPPIRLTSHFTLKWWNFTRRYAVES